MSNELKMEEVVYYSHCFYCMNLFDESERDPKYLSCHHTFCVKCLKTVINMVHQNPDTELTCPLCHKICEMPDGGADSLTTNIYALHIAKLEKLRNFWCMTCNKFAAAACKSSQHLVVDLKKSRDEVQLESIQTIANLCVAVGKREMIIEYLEAEKKQLEQQVSGDSVAELVSVEKQLAENNKQLEKLRVKAQDMIDFKHFYPGRGQTVSFCYLMEQLQRENKEALGEILQAEKVLHTISICSKDGI